MQRKTQSWSRRKLLAAAGIAVPSAALAGITGRFEPVAAAAPKAAPKEVLPHENPTFK